MAKKDWMDEQEEITRRKQAFYAAQAKAREIASDKAFTSGYGPQEKTMKTMNKVDSQELERMVDECGIDSILDELMLICYGKEEHLRENWQDETAAKQWGWIGRRVSTFTDMLRKSRKLR